MPKNPNQIKIRLGFFLTLGSTSKSKLLTMRWLFLFIPLILSFSACQSQEKETNNNKTSIFDWLSAREELVHLEIKGDLTHLFVDRHGTDHYHSAKITMNRGDSTKQMKIEIARRGVTRKKICDFPPIKLKFPKKTLAKQGLAKHNNYKLVTHCMEGEDDLVLKEYLTYKLFNQLSDNSFQVKLAKIRYLDDSGEVPDDTHYAFLIEDNKELASRLNGKILNAEKFKLTRVDKDQYKKMVLFQYMIGNTDWNLSKGHNIKWIQPKDSETPIPVPYDFDYCGLVNADYAVPHPQIPIRSVRERFLQWRGKNKEELLPVCDAFKSLKPNFFKTCMEFEYLNAATKEDMIAFLDSYFEEVEKEIRMQKS